MANTILKLYVTGQSSRTAQAVACLLQICQAQPTGECKTTVIDVLDQPQLAEDERIIATPTLVRESPLPKRRIIGDLSDMEKVMKALDLRPVAKQESSA